MPEKITIDKSGTDTAAIVRMRADSGAGIEAVHMIKKGQPELVKDETSSAADKFYSQRRIFGQGQGQGQGPRDALLLAARQLGRQAVEEHLDVQLGRQLGDSAGDVLVAAQLQRRGDCSPPSSTDS